MSRIISAQCIEHCTHLSFDYSDRLGLAITFGDGEIKFSQRLPTDDPGLDQPGPRR